MSVLEHGFDLKHDQRRFVHMTLCTMRLKSSVLKNLDALVATTAIFVCHFSGGIGATFPESS